MEDIVIDNFHIGYWDGFGYLEEAVLCIDRLINSPCSQLMKKYNLNSKMEYFHFILPQLIMIFSSFLLTTLFPLLTDTLLTIFLIFI